MKLATLAITAVLAGGLVTGSALPAMAAAVDQPTASAQAASATNRDAIASYTIKVRNNTPWDLGMITTQSAEGWYGVDAQGPNTHGPARPAAKGGLDGLTVPAGGTSTPTTIRTYGFDTTAAFSVRLTDAPATVADLTVTHPAGGAGIGAPWLINGQQRNPQIGTYQGTPVYAALTTDAGGQNTVLTISTQ